MPVEYRVRWRREGRQRTSQIYQTKEAAERKGRGIRALEQVKHETSMDEMPSLVESPYLEAREVGPWAYVGSAPEPTDKDRDGMRLHFGQPDDGYSGIF
jgi:hypothetical protein